MASQKGQNAPQQLLAATESQQRTPRKKVNIRSVAAGPRFILGLQKAMAGNALGGRLAART